MAENHDARHLRKNTRYYLTGGDLHLLAGEELFRVHRYFFDRESSVFRKWLNSPSPAGQAARGSSDGTAIMLKVTPEEMELFLWVFYNPKYSLYEAEVADWDVILGMATTWNFPEVKQLAIRELEKKLDIPLVQRIVLYQKHNLGDELLLPLYAELAMQDYPPTRDELQQLGLQTAMTIFYTRERLRSPTLDDPRSPVPTEIEKGTIMGVVQEFMRDIPRPSNGPGSPTPSGGGGINSPGNAQGNGGINGQNGTFDDDPFGF